MDTEALNAYKAGLAEDLDKRIAEKLEAEREELKAEGYDDCEVILEGSRHELEIRKAGILQGFEYGVGFAEHVAQSAEQ